jgi:hypothetical protein
VIRLRDWRRLVVPLSSFIEKPFQNWTREGASLIGSVILYVDYAANVARIREHLLAIDRESKLWTARSHHGTARSSAPAAPRPYPSSDSHTVWRPERDQRAR